MHLIATSTASDCFKFVKHEICKGVNNQSP